MRRTIFNSLSCAALCLCAAACASNTKQVTFAVDGLACPNCAGEVAHHLQEVPGVRSAKVDFASKTATVRYNADQPVSMGALQGAVKQWRVEHFGAEEDPNCLNPEERKRLQGK